MGRSLKVLYVDDEADIRSIVEFALEDEADIELRSCASGREALEAVSAFRPDLILLDVMMPAMDGPETLRRLRALPQLAGVPVLFVTAKVQPQEIEQFKAMGASGVIPKPFDPMALAGKLRALAADAAPAAPGGEAKPGRLEELRAAYGRQLGGRLDELDARWKAALAEEEGAGDAHATLHRMAHSLAGSAGTFGYERLGEVAKQLENAVAPHAGHPDIRSQRRQVQVRDLMSELRMLAAAGPDVLSAADLAAERHPEPQPEAPENRRIAIIEDDLPLAREIAAQLAPFGWDLAIYPDAAHAAHALQSEPPPAAMIVDVILPDGPLAGAEMVQQLQTQGDTRLPHIVMSARWDWEARLAAARAGADAYLVKPIDFAALAEEVDRVTHRQTVTPYRVLLLDDDRLLAEHYAHVLAAAGMASLAITDPADLLEAIAEHQPELILMDLYMPSCSGMEVATVIRQDPNFLSVPIVFLSTESGLAQQQKAMQTGADDFLEKPIADADLVHAVSLRAERFRALSALIRQDSLTGLLNHIAFKLRLEAEVDRSGRSGTPLALAMLDIDHFKQVNDTHGHPAGDRVITSVARLLQRRLRKSDIAGRYGGEEFAIALPETTLPTAIRIVDELRQHFARLRFASLKGEFSCTLSGGVSERQETAGVEDLVRTADEALYRAKQSGRNRVKMSARGEN